MGSEFGLDALDVTWGTVVFTCSADGPVRALAVEAGTVYVGGDFGTFGGQLRNRVAAVSALDGTVDGWNPNADGPVHALAVGGGVIYTGGSFTVIGGADRFMLAAVDRWSGLATSWDSNVSDRVFSLAVWGDYVLAGGAFRSAHGLPQSGVACLLRDGIVGVSDRDRGPSGQLHLSFMNPGSRRHDQRIDYEIPEAGRVTVSVFDVQGREVTRLVDELRTAGRHQVVWTAGVGAGAPRPGVYIVRLETSGRIVSSPLVRL